LQTALPTGLFQGFVLGKLDKNLKVRYLRFKAGNQLSLMQ